MINNLLLMSGNDLLFPEADVVIHQPTIKEIAYIGEDEFFSGCGFLNFSKEMLENSDKKGLEQCDDFDILMSIMINKDPALKEHIECGYAVLSLIFPLYQVSIESKTQNETCIVLTDKNGIKHFLDKTNFKQFKLILQNMFGLKIKDGDLPKSKSSQGTIAKHIAEKLKQRQIQLAKRKGQKDSGKMHLFGRYISILAVGLGKSMNDLLQYTVYQLQDEFQRFGLKVKHDLYIKAKLAGAKDMEEVEDWMKELHEEKEK